VLNDTLTSLIPKVDILCYMKNFYPICLCNVSYKTITILLARRLRCLSIRNKRGQRVKNVEIVRLNVMIRV